MACHRSTRGVARPPECTGESAGRDSSCRCADGNAANMSEYVLTVTQRQRSFSMGPISSVKDEEQFGGGVGAGST